MKRNLLILWHFRPNFYVQITGAMPDIAHGHHRSPTANSSNSMLVPAILCLAMPQILQIPIACKQGKSKSKSRSVQVLPANSRQLIEIGHAP